MPGLELPFEVKRPTIRVARREDMRGIIEAALPEKASVVCPSHVMERDATVVGYGSAGKMGLITGWTSASVDDETSLAALRAMENAASMTGVDLLVVACTEDCRFKPFMQSQGYTEGGKQVTMFYKKVR